MAITDFTTLRNEIQVYAARSDSVFSNRIETFVAFAEDRIYSGAGRGEQDPLYSEPLRTKVMEGEATLTFADSGSGYSTATLPEDATDFRKIARDGDQEGISFLEPKFFMERTAQLSSGSTPSFYTVEAGVLKLAPSYVGDIQVSYWKRFSALSIDAPTNDLLTAFPLVYLNACMYEAFSFMQEPNEALGWLARYRSQVAGLNKTASSARYPGRMQIRPRRVIGGKG